MKYTKIGVRVKDSEILTNLNPGEYTKHNGIWYFAAANWGIANLASHKAIEHENGAITVEPSILIKYYDYDSNCDAIWHGYLTNGVTIEI